MRHKLEHGYDEAVERPSILASIMRTNYDQIFDGTVTNFSSTNELENTTVSRIGMQRSILTDEERSQTKSCTNKYLTDENDNQ